MASLESVGTAKGRTMLRLVYFTAVLLFGPACETGDDIVPPVIPDPGHVDSAQASDNSKLRTISS